jgi:hypothetical protein
VFAQTLAPAHGRAHACKHACMHSFMHPYRTRARTPLHNQRCIPPKTHGTHLDCDEGISAAMVLHNVYCCVHTKHMLEACVFAGKEAARRAAWGAAAALSGPPRSVGRAMTCEGRRLAGATFARGAADRTGGCPLLAWEIWRRGVRGCRCPAQREVTSSRGDPAQKGRPCSSSRSPVACRCAWRTGPASPLA